MLANKFNFFTLQRESVGSLFRFYNVEEKDRGYVTTVTKKAVELFSYYFEAQLNQFVQKNV